MGPCHAEKPARQSAATAADRSQHSRSASMATATAVPATSAAVRSSKPKLLFKLLVNDEEQDPSKREESLGSGFLRSFDVDATIGGEGSQRPRDPPEAESFLGGNATKDQKRNHQFHLHNLLRQDDRDHHHQHHHQNQIRNHHLHHHQQQQQQRKHHQQQQQQQPQFLGRELDHMVKVEMARNKLKILLTEPLDRRSSSSSSSSSSSFSTRSVSEPVTPPPPQLRNMIEFGKRTNSEGSQYKSLILKKRQKDMMLGPTSRENPSMAEDQLENKRMRNVCHDARRPDFTPLAFKAPGGVDCETRNQPSARPEPAGKNSLLKELLSSTTDDEVRQFELLRQSEQGLTTRKLADCRRSLSNSDIYSVSAIKSFAQPTQPLVQQQAIERTASRSVGLSRLSSDSLFGYLCNSVRYALQLPGFELLPVDDKRPMIVRAAPRLILLYMASDGYRLELSSPDEPERSQDGPRPTPDFVESVRLFIRRFQQHRVTEEESSCLKDIVIYQYSDPDNPLRAGDRANANLLESIERLRSLSMADKDRHSRLLLLLHSLFQLDLKTLENLFFQPLLSCVESLKKFRQLYPENGWLHDDRDAQGKLH